MGAHIGPLHPIELAVRRQLSPRTLKHPGPVTYGPTDSGNDGAGALSGGFPSIVLDCSTGSDGVLTLLPVSNASPTNLPSSEGSSPSAANSNANSRTSSGAQAPDSSLPGNSGDPMSCTVDPNASFPADFGYPGPDCIGDEDLSAPASGASHPVFSPTTENPGGSDLTGSPSGLENGAPGKSPCDANAVISSPGECDGRDGSSSIANKSPYIPSGPSSGQSPNSGAGPCNDPNVGDGAANDCPQPSSLPTQAPGPVSPYSDRGSIGGDPSCDSDGNDAGLTGQSTCSSLTNSNAVTDSQGVPVLPDLTDGQPCPDEEDGGG